MDMVSGSATPQTAVTLQHLSLTQITIESSKSRGTKGEREKGNYHNFFKNYTWFLCLSRRLWDGPIKIGHSHYTTEECPSLRVPSSDPSMRLA